MNKIVIISGTNRPGSNTLKVSKVYESMLKELGAETLLLDFQLLPKNISAEEAFGKNTGAYMQLMNDYVITQNKFVFVSPEYNGSFPGILKTFLDSVHPRVWNDKKACLVGVSDGRAGNLRGMEHLTGVLQYLKMHVYHNKLPISSVTKVMDASGRFNEDQLKVSTAQMVGFMGF